MSPAAAARQARRRRIADLIRREQVVSQEQLAERLAAEGLSATQATVSRDLEELGAVKVRRVGVQTYALPDQVAGRDWPAERLQRVMRDWVISIEAAGPLVVVKTPPGSAHLVAAALDAAERTDVAGSIAGDDTLFLAIRDGERPATVAERLQAIAGLDGEAGG